MLGRWCLFLCAAACVGAHDAGASAATLLRGVVPTSISVDQIMCASVMVGNPAREYRLELDPMADGITIGLGSTDYHNWVSFGTAPSVSYDSGHDYVSIGDNTYVDRVQYVSRESLASADIHGVWGVSTKNVLWSFYSTFSLSIGTLRLGHKNDVFESLRHASVPILRCLDSDSAALCRFVGFVDGKKYFVDLFHRGAKIRVPPALYQRYVLDQALVGDQVGADIGIEIAPEHYVLSASAHPPAAPGAMDADAVQRTCVATYRAFGFAGVETCNSRFELTISPDMYVDASGTTPRNMLVLSTSTYPVDSNSTELLPVIVLPTTLLKNIMVHGMLGTNNTFVAIKRYAIYTTQTGADIAILFVITISYILYQVALEKYNKSSVSSKDAAALAASAAAHAEKKAVRPPDRRAGHDGAAQRHITHKRQLYASTGFVCNEIVGIVASVVIVSPFKYTFGILQDFHYLTMTSFPLVAAVAAAALALIAFLFNASLFYYTPRQRVVLAATRRFCYEFVVLHGLWGSFVHLRNSEIGTVVTCVWAVWMLFIMVRICTEMLVGLAYLGAVRAAQPRAPRSADYAWPCAAAQLALIAYHAHFTYVYNLLPYTRAVFVLFTASTEQIAIGLLGTCVLYAITTGLAPYTIERILRVGRHQFLRKTADKSS